MKNIQAQYQDLLEGRMSKSNFMRNVRMQFPQHVSPTTSYDDSVKILKGKRILNEAKKPEGVYGHNPNAEAEKSRGIDHLNYYQVYHGIQYELAKMPEITDENYVKARKKVVDTILKDPDAYKELQLANFKAVKEIDKDLEMKDVKKNNLTDKPNEMKAVKKDEKANTQDTLEKKERRKAKNGKGLQHMTQTPKGKLEAFATPGKEKTLKENIKEAGTTAKTKLLDLLQTKDLDFEEFLKDTKMYRAKHRDLDNLVRNDHEIQKFISDEIKDRYSGGIIHYRNESVKALKENIMREMTTQNPHHEDLHKGSVVFKKKGDSGPGKVIEFDGHTASVEWENGKKEDLQKNVLTKQEPPKTTVELPSDAPKIRTMAPWNNEVHKSAKEEVTKEDKKASIKDKLMKTIKELLFKNKKTGTVQSFQQNDPAIKDPQFNQVFTKA